MGLLSISLIIIGAPATFSGAKWTIKSLFVKSIVNYKQFDFSKPIEINEKGLYSIGVLGAGQIKYVKQAKFTLVGISNQNEIKLKENFFKYQFFKDFRRGIEFMQFKITAPGKYQLKLEKVDKLEFKASPLFIAGLLSSNLEGKQLEILIRKTLPVVKKIFGTILLVLGVNMLLWGVMLTFYEERFQ